MSERTHSIAPTCPPWCTETNETHRSSYDSAASDNSRELHRYHTRDFGAAAVIQDEASVDGDAIRALATVVVYDDSARLPAQARKLAADVLNAADFAEEINGEGAGR